MVKIQEPMTVLTDLFITLGGGYWGIRLIGYPPDSMQFLWGWAFAGIAIGSLLGAIRHAGNQTLPTLAVRRLNRGTYLSIGITGYFLLAGTTRILLPEPASALLYIVYGLITVYFLFQVFRKMQYRIVVYYYLPILGYVLITMVNRIFINPHTGAVEICWGILMSFLAAGVQLSGFSLHQHFNHNDLYHLIQLAGLGLIYQGLTLWT